MAKGVIPSLASDHVFNKTRWNQFFFHNEDDEEFASLEDVAHGEEARVFLLEMVEEALAEKTKFGY